MTTTVDNGSLTDYDVASDTIAGAEYQKVKLTDPTLYFKAASFRLFYYGDSSISDQTEKASWFISSAPSYTFVFAPKAGGLSSRQNTRIENSQTAYLAGGLPVSGSTSISITQTGTGGLIVSGSGSASITLSQTGTILSIAAASGSSTITLSGSALIGALAGLSGSGNVTISPTAAIKAIGYLSGLSTNEAEFSPEALARAVWNAITSDYNESGTMGEMLNNSGAGSNPWGALLADNNDANTFGERVQKLLTTAKFLGLK